MEIIKPVAGQPEAPKEEEHVMLAAPEGITGVTHEGALYQVHDGHVRVKKHMVKHLKEQGFTDPKVVTVDVPTTSSQ